MATTRKKEAEHLPDWFTNGMDNMGLHHTRALTLARAGNMPGAKAELEAAVAQASALVELITPKAEGGAA